MKSEGSAGFSETPQEEQGKKTQQLMYRQSEVMPSKWRGWSAETWVSMKTSNREGRRMCSWKYPFAQVIFSY